MTKALTKRERSTLAQRRRNALARVSALSALFGSTFSVVVLAIVLFFAGSLHVSLLGAVLFGITLSTFGAYWFGKQGGRLLKEEDDDD